MMTREIIAIPMGDAAGIGPEIALKALKNKELYFQCKPLIIGDLEVLKRANTIVEGTTKFHRINEPKEGIYEYGTVDIIDLHNISIDKLVYGKVLAQCGRASFDYIKKSVELAMDNEVAAIATPPINKEALKAANIRYIGHTEMLEALAKSYDPLTMFEVKGLRIFFLTRHVSLKDAIGLVTKERVYEYLTRCKEALRRLGIENGKFAVAGLNPHSGESGLFGMEEVNEISPGIKLAQQSGVNVVGPVPADSVFFQALNGKYDAVLSLYHDQGHIAAKMTDFHRTVSLTNGLPFLRTSVDHGTAFDIAGKNIAESISMEEAIKVAAQYATSFKKNKN